MAQHARVGCHHQPGSEILSRYPHALIVSVQLTRVVKIQVCSASLAVNGFPLDVPELLRRWSHELVRIR
jgi:hypothetical protein